MPPKGGRTGPPEEAYRPAADLSRAGVSIAPQRGANRSPKGLRPASLRVAPRTPPRPSLLGREKQPLSPMQKAGQPFRFALMLRIKPGRVVPTERSDWGQHSSGKDCLRNPPSPWIFEKRLFGKRSASGRRRGRAWATGVGEGSCGQAGRFAGLSTCPARPPSCPSACTSTVVAKAGFQDVRLFGFRLLKILRRQLFFLLINQQLTYLNPSPAVMG